MKEPLLTFPILIMTVISFIAAVSGGFDFANLSNVIFLFFTAGAIIGAAAAINFLGSGLNASGTSIVFQGAALLTLWSAFSIISGSYLVFGGLVGSSIYAMLTIMFAVGGVLHIRGGGI
jgi:hypothetical protein